MSMSMSMSICKSQRSAVSALRTCKPVFHSAQPTFRPMSLAAHHVQHEPVFASNSDESQLLSSLRALTPPIGRWNIISSGHGIERTFKFKTFKAAWAFMSDVAAACKSERHHPEWSNVYNSVFVRWTTHNPPGLSGLDVKLAKLCDEFAGSTELAIEGSPAGGETSEESQTSQGLKDLADQGSSEAGKPEEEAQRQKEKEKIEKEESESGKEGSIAGIGGQPS